MLTKAVRLYDKFKLQLDTFELPEMTEDEILVKVVSDSVCMSTYKAVSLGSDHKRVPNDINENPVVMGHEFAGVIVKVGKRWQNDYKAGDKFTLQPALNYKGSMDSPGYSFRWYGGNMTYAIIPKEVMEINCFIKYEGDAFYEAGLAEPMSCVIGAFHAAYHTIPSTYTHVMDIKAGGALAILGGCGPMGLGAIDYAIHRDIKPSVLVVTDISNERLARAEEIIPVEEAKKHGVTLHYVNPTDEADQISYLKSFTNGLGFDDVFVFVPNKALAEQGDQILGKDGTLNFFAGPTDTSFSANINLYNIHYGSTKIIGSTGGNTDDMIESLTLTAQKRINPSNMVTHIGGIDSAIDTIINLPNIPGGKKLIYNHVNMPLTAIEDLHTLESLDPKFKELAEICKKHKNLWSLEAENFLLEHFEVNE
ncbi:MAG: zinc-binding dehydrogenase [Candidatus Izemoplasmataceae bacterium]